MSLADFFARLAKARNHPGIPVYTGPVRVNATPEARAEHRAQRLRDTLPDPLDYRSPHGRPSPASIAAQTAAHTETRVLGRLADLTSLHGPYRAATEMHRLNLWSKP